MNSIPFAFPRNLLAVLISATAFVATAHAQPPSSAREEIIVTATRVETNLQETPMSVAAFTGDYLELAGIDTGRELGIMVPNVVINPGPTGEFYSSLVIRGLPGVTTYFDGMWFSNVGLARWAPAFQRDRVRLALGRSARVEAH